MTFENVEEFEGGIDPLVAGWGPLALEASKLTGWPVTAIDAVKYNGMGPRTNARVWNKSGRYLDVKLPEHML